MLTRVLSYWGGMMFTVPRRHKGNPCWHFILGVERDTINDNQSFILYKQF
jgi:hypothetical protein